MKKLLKKMHILQQRRVRLNEQIEKVKKSIKDGHIDATTDRRLEHGA